MRMLLLAAVLLSLSACNGSVPNRDTPPESGTSAILIGGRMLLPSGESRDGATYINFESDGDQYRLPLRAADNALYRVEPGLYRLSPPRGAFGSVLPEMTVRLEGHVYRVPFPRELMRLAPYEVKPGRVLAVGILEASLPPALPGQRPQMRVRLDDSVQARRHLVQEMIKTMMDPRRPESSQDNAVSWSRALQNSLMEILSEEEKRSLYKPAP